MDNESLVSLIQKNIGRTANLEQLYLNNKGIISKLAYRYCSHNDYDDLMQEGFLALEHAAETYDHDQGVAFFSYALKAINNRMLSYIHECGYCVRVPEGMCQRIKLFKEFVETFQKQYGYYPDTSDVVAALNLTLEQVEEVKRTVKMLASNISIDQPVDGESDDITYADFIPDPEDPIDEIIRDNDLKELSIILWQDVDDLQGKYQPEVLRMRFKEDKTLKECGERLGIKGERVRTIQNDGLKHLKQVHCKELIPYYNEFVYRQGLKHTSFSAFRYTNESSVERAVRLLDEMDPKE